MIYSAKLLTGYYVIAYSAVLEAVDEFVRMREITHSVKAPLKCLIAVILVDVDLLYWTSKVAHSVAFTVIFSNICTAHVQKRLFMNFRCTFRHHRSIRRLRCPIWVQNFGDLAAFSVDFCILYAECPPYFYFRFVWPTDLESIPHASTPTSSNSHQVWSWYDHPLPSYSVFVWPCDLDLWPFDLEQLSCMAGHVTNPATKFEDPKTICSWVTSYNGSHWLPLKMCTRPLRMRRITWPVSRGSKTITFLNPRPRFAYSLFNFYWAPTTIKGRLLSIRLMKALVWPVATYGCES